MVILTPKLLIVATVAFVLGIFWMTGCSHPLRTQSLAPMTGQIIIDPEHPAWLMKKDGHHIFICGPGDPEDFLYRGRRNPDGTRAGDQDALIEKLVRNGGNCIYMQIVRTHGGDAGDDPTQNPFIDSDPEKGLDSRILAQWEGWFNRMDENNILIYLIFYDDSSCIWHTGNRVCSRERDFFQEIVRRFQHHRNLIWLVGEESEEAYSNQRVQKLAQIIRQADSHGHLIGNHHLPGTTFKAWQPDGFLNHFAMQFNAVSSIAAHEAAVEAFTKAAGRYTVMYAENTGTGTNAVNMRRFAWASAMGGLMPMLLHMNIADTPDTSLRQCRSLQRFFESTDFWKMSPHDELRGAGTEYVLADPGHSYIAYSSKTNAPLTIKNLPAGRCAMKWMDCRTGLTIRETRSSANPIQTTFARPRVIGPECVVWIHFNNAVTNQDLNGTPSESSSTKTPAAGSQDYFPPPESQGGWRTLDQPDQIRELAGMDPEQLADLTNWLSKSDRRDFAAVVIRHGYVVLQVEHGNSARTNSERVASLSKAVCAIVLSIASERSQHGQTSRKMTFDDPAFQFIPWAQPLSDPRKATITVRELLNHTSGICPESTGAPNDGSWDYVLGHSGDPRTAQLAFPPGQGCGYSTLAYDHAALVCEDVTGTPYDQFAITSLFQPIGCEHWQFQFFDSQTIGRHPNHGLGMPALDLARIGYCMLRDGRWQQRQVIPQWYIDDIAAPRSPHGFKEMRWGADSGSYADGWQLPEWLSTPYAPGIDVIPADARFKPGSGGQFIAYVPSLDLVITRQTGAKGDWNYQEYLRRACRAVIR